MKNVIKSMAAIVLVLAVVLTSFVPAFAATKEEAYEAAVATGAPAQNLAELKNYLNAVPFTAAEYDEMVDYAERVKNIVNSYSVNMYNVVPGKLTETQKVEVFKSMSASTRANLIDLLVTLGDNVGVKVDVDFLSIKKGYTVSATDKNGKVVISSTSKPVVDTSVDYTMTVVLAVAVLALATVVTVVMSKKAHAER